jgi:hypothetical protein
MYYAAQDILEYLMNSTGGGAQDNEHRMLRAAAANAYRDVMNARDWHWHVATDTLQIGGGTDAVTLPENVKNIDSLLPPLSMLRPVQYIAPNEFERLDILLPTLTSPVYWTVVKDPSRPDRWMLKVVGAPPSMTFTYTYRRRPSPLKYMGYEPAARDGSVATNGLVKRYGTASHFPEGLGGLHPYTAQEIIGLTGSLVGSAPANAKTCVSDYIDASDGMFTAILSGAELWLAKLMGKNVEGALAVYNRDLRIAFEADVVAPVSGMRGDTARIGVPRALGYYSPSAPDTGV